jgi:hypothetical protein
MKRYILLLGLPLAAQERTLQCDERSSSRRGESFCEMREVTVSAAGSLEVDGRQNGGIQVKGWKQSNILVRAKVQAHASTESEARSLVSQVRIETAGSRVRAEGPSTRDREWWSTSYEIFVPQAIDLTLRAHNGGIGILDVRGRIDFSTVNGGISLAGVAGNVRGRTVNGGVSAQLEGERWDGEGLDLETTNGGVALQVPDRYSARLETGTVNGGLRIDFPVTVQGSITKRLNVQLGSGGPTIRAVTVNGGVTVRQKSRPI